MSRKESVLHKLRNKGHRITKVRDALVDVLATTDAPLSALDLQSYLEKNHIKVNKTTVYREISFLRDQKVIHEIQFGDGKSRFRACPDVHHHHAICVRCNRVEEIVAEGDFLEKEREMARGMSFRVLYHTLEFFGVCRDCDGPEVKG